MTDDLLVLANNGADPNALGAKAMVEAARHAHEAGAYEERDRLMDAADAFLDRYVGVALPDRYR